MLGLLYSKALTLPDTYPLFPLLLPQALPDPEWQQARQSIDEGESLLSCA